MLEDLLFLRAEKISHEAAGSSQGEIFEPGCLVDSGNVKPRH